jgi:hypothetical protein
MEIEPNFIAPIQPSPFDAQDLFMMNESTPQQDLMESIEAPVVERKKAGRPKATRTAPANEMGLMVSYAQNNGFLNAKFLRCKALHEFLFEKLWDSTTFKNNGVFNTAMLFREIPFLLFLQIIGVFVIEPEVEAFLNMPEQHGVTVEDLPGSLRAIVTGQRTKFRAGLKVIVHILCALGLLEPVPEPLKAGQEKSFPSDFELKYKMIKRVAFYNYIAKNQPFIRFFEIKAEGDLKIFWAHLQYSCSDRRHDKGVGGEDDVVGELGAVKMKVLAGIDNPRYGVCVVNFV